MALMSSLGSKIVTGLQFVFTAVLHTQGSRVYTDGSVGVGETVLHDLGKSQEGV